MRKTIIRVAKINKKMKITKITLKILKSCFFIKILKTMLILKIKILTLRKRTYLKFFFL